MTRYLQLIALAMLPVVIAVGTPPEGFTRTVMSGDYEEIIGITPTGDGRFLAWERGGLVWILSADGEASETPFLNLSEEVLPWRDHGFMGFTTDPDFLDNGLVYALYVVDPHHLYMYGSSAYDPTETWTNMATIGRLTRYQATAASDFSIVDPSTRTVLVGESIDTGIPILHQSHGLGSMFFGTDGSLLFSMGDSASYLTVDTGGQTGGGWINEALRAGIMTEEEDVGAFRSQLVNSLCGKIIRVDPETGDGLASNPYFDEKDPRASKSRVWALGLRNGFRCSLLRGTGSDDPSLGDPGSIVVSDVGWSTREETSIIPNAGTNLGWPLFEGFDYHSGYFYSGAENPTAFNPLTNESCPENFRFRDLIQEERPGGPLFSNPCHAAWIEAEDATSNGLKLNLEEPGITGSGSMQFDGSGSEWVEFKVNGDEAQPITFGLRYALLSDRPAQLRLFIDGSESEVISLDPTPCGHCWDIYSFELSLDPGTRFLTFEDAGAQGLLIDRLEISNIDYSPMPADVATFTHHRPVVDWSHFSSSAARVAGDVEGIPVPILLNSPDSPVEGESFGGVCASGSETIIDSSWPAEYRGVYFVDFYYQWIRLIQFDTEGNPVRIRNFETGAGWIADLAYDEASGDLIAIVWDGNPVRYSPPPVRSCPGDFNEDGIVDGGDIGLLLSDWKTPNADLNHDGITDGADIGLLLSLWGPCSP